MIDELTVKDILSDLSKGDYACFASEAQLRDAFAIALALKHPDCVVYPEYTQQRPNIWRCSEQLIHFDLLVKEKSTGETILFEFKYKTKKSDFVLPVYSIYLKDHSDTWNGRYALWRDIYRIETFASLKNITKGFIVFICNNSGYWSIPKKGSCPEEFSLAEGLHEAGNRNWKLPAGQTLASVRNIGDSYKKDIYPLITENDYYFQYDVYSQLKDTRGVAHAFRQLVVPIHSKDYNDQIETALRKIGKATFVKHYVSFKDETPDECKRILIGANFSKDSANTIVSAAKQLFGKKQNIEALRNIIASSKVDDAIRKEALKLL